jgi:hypothetical protein
MVHTAVLCLSTGKFLPSACGYNGAPALDTKISLRKGLDRRPKAQENMLNVSIRNFCTAFSAMVDVRCDCLVPTNQSSHACDSTHTGRV